MSSNFLVFLGALMVTASAFCDDAFDGVKRDSKAGETQHKSEMLPDDETSRKGAENMRGVALQALDQLIEQLKRIGNTEDVADWQTYRNQFPMDDECYRTVEVGMYTCKLADELLKRNELLAARDMVPYALRIAEVTKGQAPKLFIRAQSEAAIVDVEFEFYESAVKHMLSALEVANQGTVDERSSNVCRLTYAFVLREMGRFDESEKIYVDAIQQAKINPVAFPVDGLFKLRMALAVVYAKKGDFRKYSDALPDGGKPLVGEDGNTDREVERCKTMAFVNYNLTPGQNVDVAAKTGQELVGYTQEIWGSSSREHIQAIELLAEVRVAQSRYDEAIELLKKSATLRAGLLGSKHASIARQYKEIDAIRKKQLDAAAPIWDPGSEGFGPEPIDRYSQLVQACVAAASREWVCRSLAITIADQAVPTSPGAIGIASGYIGTMRLQ